MFKRLLGIGSNPNRIVVDELYGQIVAAARQPVFYSDWEVPDTPLGHFEMISIALFLTLRRLRGERGASSEIAQDLVDTFFKELDHSIRELGIGDMGVPKRMKKLAKMFYGRAASYGKALDDADEAALAEALRRNIQPTADEWHGAPHLARYTVAAAGALASQPLDEILAGAISFPSPGNVPSGEPA